MFRRYSYLCWNMQTKGLHKYQCWILKNKMCMSEAAQASTNSKWTLGCGKRRLPPTTSRLSTGFRQQICAAHRKIILITDVAERRQNGFPPTNCSEKNSCCKASQAQPQPVALVTKSNWQVVTITVQTWTTFPTKLESIRQLKQKGLFSCGKKDASTTHLRRLRAGNCFINSHFYFWLKVKTLKLKQRELVVFLGDLHRSTAGTHLTHRSCIKQLLFALVLE